MAPPISHPHDKPPRNKGKFIKYGLYAVWGLCVVAIAFISASLIARLHTPDTTPAPETAFESGLEALDSMETLSFSEDTSVFANPERGFYYPYGDGDDGASVKLSESSLEKLRGQNISLILYEVNLKNFKTGPISDTKLTEIKNNFAIAKKAGVKVIFRAAYGYTDADIAPEPSDINILLNHIEQFKDVFTTYEDVLYTVQAGFLGTWGEWHSTVYGTNENGKNKQYNTVPTDVAKKVIDALLEAVPASRTIQVRTPRYIMALYPNETLTDATAFSGKGLARIGFHNDGMFAGEDDLGTYATGKGREYELAWANTQMKYTPYGGESCTPPTAYSTAANISSEFTKLHAQYANISYHEKMIADWKATTYNDNTLFDYISSKLGYKFSLTSAKISSKVSAGGVLHLQFDIKNSGFGNLINIRNYEVILSNGSTTYKATVKDDIRKWYAESGAVSNDLYLTIPANIALGTWSIYLNFPDISSDLAGNPDYSIRLANENIWDGSTGYNLLKSNIVIDSAIKAASSNDFSVITRKEAEELLDSSNAF